jgi:hypothetical protein
LYIDFELDFELISTSRPASPQGVARQALLHRHHQWRGTALLRRHHQWRGTAASPPPVARHFCVATTSGEASLELEKMLKTMKK